MKSGLSYPSHARNAAWTISGGTAHADFPVVNLCNLEEIRTVFVASGTGTRTIMFTLPAAVPIDFLAFIHHNAGAADTYRIRLSAGTDGSVSPLWDSGVVNFWPGGVVNTDYSAVRPISVPLITARSGHILLSAHATGWEIGGFEVGQFWTWQVQVDREIGFDDRSSTASSGGLSHITNQWSPRLVKGNRDIAAQSEVDITLLDFQRDTGLWRAFVWVWDLDDSATWPREAFLATNDALIPGTVPNLDVGKMSFAFREHLR